MAWVILKHHQILLHLNELLAEGQHELLSLIISITCVPKKRLLHKHLEENYHKQGKRIWD